LLESRLGGKEDKGKKTTRVDLTIIVAIVAGGFSVRVAMIGQGGLIDRFYSPVIEAALNQTQENKAWS
jgi:hypothetical protein